MNKPQPFLITSFELADRLGVSEHTALRYMQRMRKELGLPPRELLKRKQVYEYFGISD